jgi:hypothetical protein
MRCKRKLNRSGTRIAEEDAKIAINSTETETLPVAIAVSGGAKGAPGHTATRRNPTATSGLAWNRDKSRRVVPGTRR